MKISLKDWASTRAMYNEQCDEAGLLDDYGLGDAFDWEKVLGVLFYAQDLHICLGMDGSFYADTWGDSFSTTNLEEAELLLYGRAVEEGVLK